ncbi:UVI-1 protein [Hyaloscypha variabilis F]|uniref:UVI-1 protein n=1 Tax=Hyaloscypha variabilis (strain UAMH 11265 / GT02V1 / F) TaxID=1149755 RepID=A0A2J6QT35_HYAVF|nr:UVI-1 protein [Hyaloscypha variabilis F]
MHFTKVFVAITATMTSVYAQLTAPQIVSNINIVTSDSQALQAPANSINILSGPLFLIGQGPFPQIVIGFTQIVNTVTDDIQAMQGTQPFNVLSDENSILDAFTTFVEVHQELLQILIGKAGLLNDLPFVGPPVAQVLRNLESVVDTIAFALIDLVPDVAGRFTDQKNTLDVTIGQAIDAYTPAV